MNDIPVYLFTGFMDSGKTSIIVETLVENDFGNGNKNLIIACEDGDVEYDEEKLRALGTEVVWIESKEDFTAKKLAELNAAYHPDAVFIEYNGTWEYALFADIEFPKGWVLVQIIATAEASSFEMYMLNMRNLMVEQIFNADVVIFNRCPDDVNKLKFRQLVKSVNKRAQLVYELMDGSIDEREEELPFDISGSVLELSDTDYGLWYLDALDNSAKYEGKQVKFLAKIYKPEKLIHKDVFVPGRFAMTCCEDDITFIGFKCKGDTKKEMVHKSWVNITATVHVEFAKEYKKKGPVLYLDEWSKAEAPEDELVYFN